MNKAETRVEAVWNIAESRALTEAQRERLLRKLATRVDGLGRLRVAAETYRSQARNREEAVARIQAMVREALKVPKPRKKTKPSRAAVERRLEEKRARGARKRRRGPVGPDE